jgi:flagellar basal-body rod protein FlgB
MWLREVTQTGVDAVLEKVVAFTEGRHCVLAENIANIDTPGYRAKQLDAKLFQASLQKAIQEKGGDRDRPLRIEATRQFHTDEQGMLQVTPTLKPPENVLFHDGTNASIERQMAELAENTLMHQAAVELQRQRISLIKQAIAGRVT